MYLNKEQFLHKSHKFIDVDFMGGKIQLKALSANKLLELDERMNGKDADSMTSLKLTLAAHIYDPAKQQLMFDWDNPEDLELIGNCPVDELKGLFFTCAELSGMNNSEEDQEELEKK